jgi:uncharacterized protein
MSIQSIAYFDKPGEQNTEAVAGVVRSRCQELGIRHVVVASCSGATARKLADALKGTGAAVVAVAEHAGFQGGDAPSLSDAERQALEAQGIRVLVATHALSGVGRSITKKFGGVTPVEIIAATLRLFGTEGIKVAVEAAVMAADAGLVPTDREIIAVGGTESGADTAVVLRAAHMNNFFDLEVREILAKPRQRG